MMRLARIGNLPIIGFRAGLIVALFALPAAQAGTVSVTVSPAKASLAPNATQQFSATVSGAADQKVVWLVNGVRGGAPALGTISASGLYTAPFDVAKALSVKIEAASVAAPLATGEAGVDVTASSQSGPSFYVAATGNDKNPGTAAAPWATIQHAVDTVPAGATILVHGGVYHEHVAITRSGSAAAGFISLEPLPGETAVLDGTGLDIPTGQYGLFTIDNASWIRIEGFEIRNYVSNDRQVPIGIYVEGAGSHIELLANHVHHIVTTLTTSAADALGIAVYGSKAPAAISDVIIDGNEIDHLITGFSESLSLSGNVTLWQVTGNLIHDNNNIGINVEGFFRTAPDPAFDRARDGLVAGNTVYDITSAHNPSYHDTLGADGVYIDGGTGVTVQQNIVYRTDIGIELASEIHGRATTHVLAHDNLVYASYLVGVSLGGAGRRNGGTRLCTVANNTLFEDDTTRSGSGEFQIQHHAKDNLVFNNIMYATSQGLLVNSFVPQNREPATFNNNLYFSAASGSSYWKWRGKKYVGFAAYQSGTGNDSKGLFDDPLFLSLSTPDLRVESNSPAIDMGADLGLVATGLVDVAGNPRTIGRSIDIGAYEH